MAVDPECIVADARAGRAVLDRGPAWVILELTQRCNLWCIMCREREQPVGGDLAGDALDRACAHLADAAVVVLNGWGEPLMHREFPRVLARIRAVAPGAVVRFNTNAELLRPRLAGLLVDDAHPSVVTFSCDGATPSTYETVRRGADFARSLRNLRLLLELRRARGSRWPRLSIEMVVQQANVHEVAAVVALGARLGADEVYLEEVLPPPSGRPLREMQADAATHVGQWTVACAIAARHGMGLGGAAALRFARAEAAAAGPAGPVPPRMSDARATPFCYEPFQTVSVQFDGGVRPCCRLPDPVANLRERPLGEIWNGPEFQALRAAMAAGTPPSFCAGCMDSGHHVPVAHGPATAAPRPAAAEPTAAPLTWSA